MDIKIGEFVRTKKGIIAKVQSYQDIIYYDGSGKKAIFYNYETDKGIIADIDIAKHSKNVIKLLKEEDLVVLEYYVRKYGKRVTRIFEIIIGKNTIYFDNAHCSFTYDLEKKRWIDGKGYNPQVKYILTKEQFNKDKYKVEE